MLHNQAQPLSISPAAHFTETENKLHSMELTEKFFYIWLLCPSSNSQIQICKSHATPHRLPPLFSVHNLYLCVFISISLRFASFFSPHVRFPCSFYFARFPIIFFFIFFALVGSAASETFYGLS